MPRLLEFSFRIIAIVSIVNYFLFRLRLAKSKTFDILSKLIASLILAWTDCLRLTLGNKRLSSFSTFVHYGRARS